MTRRSLPSPSGPYRVGTGNCEMVDSGRPSMIGAEEPGRKLFIKYWYPADGSMVDDSMREQLWSQLRNDKKIPGLAKLLLRRAMATKTNSSFNAPFSPEVKQPRVLIYNHGMISFASENTMLMEQLASNGYIVLSLQHVDQLSELRAGQQQLPDTLKEEQSRLQKEIQNAVDGLRAELSSRYYKIATNTNRIVAARAEDNEYVAKNISNVIGLIPEIKYAGSVKLVGVIGLSLGGAVATEYAKNNPKVDFVVNLDGGIYGERLDIKISQAYLMLYSHENKGCNEIALSATENSLIETEVIQDTKHLNFHEISYIYPIIKWTRTTGKADPVEVIHQRNQLIGNFIASVERASA